MSKYNVTVSKYVSVQIFPSPVDIRLSGCCSVIFCMLGVSHETDFWLGSRSGGALYKFVSSYQSETSGWMPAPSHRVACPDTTCLSASAWAQPWQLCIDYLKGDSAGFFFSSPLSSLHWHRTELQSISLTFLWKPNATVWLVSDGIASFPFLNSPVLDYAYDDSFTPQVSFSSHAKKLRNYRCSVSHISPVYRKSESSRVRPATGMFAVLT